jgi:hypothetical protein
MREEIPVVALYLDSHEHWVLSNSSQGFSQDHTIVVDCSEIQFTEQASSSSRASDLYLGVISANFGPDPGYPE